MKGQVKVYEQRCLATRIEDLPKLLRSVIKIKCKGNGYGVPSPVAINFILSLFLFYSLFRYYSSNPYVVSRGLNILRMY